MDLATLNSYLTAQNPIYSECNVYAKIDGDWLQCDAAVLETKTKKIYKGKKPPPESLGYDGNIYIEIFGLELRLKYETRYKAICIEKTDLKRNESSHCYVYANDITLDTTAQGIPCLRLTHKNKHNDFYLQVYGKDPLAVIYGEYSEKKPLIRIPDDAENIS